MALYTNTPGSVNRFRGQDDDRKRNLSAAAAMGSPAMKPTPSPAAQSLGAVDGMKQKFMQPVAKPAMNQRRPAPQGPLSAETSFRGHGISPDYGRSRQGQGSSLLDQALGAVKNMPTGPGGFKGRAGKARSQTRQIKQAGMLADILSGAYNTERKEQGETGRLNTQQTGRTLREGTHQTGANERVGLQQAGASSRASLGEIGATDRLMRGQQHELELGEQEQGSAMDQLNRKGVLDKEKDIRGLGANAVMAGVNTPGAANLLDYSGDQQVPSLGAVQFPQKKDKLMTPQFIAGDSLTGTSDRVFDPNTRRLESIPMEGQQSLGNAEQAMGNQQGNFTEDDVLVTENFLGKNFNPQRMTDEQLKYLDDLYVTNPALVQHLYDKYTAGPGR